MIPSIYQIESEYIALAQSIIDADGEITPEQEAALAINKEQLENKGRGYAFVVKTLESEVDIIDSEILRLTALKKARNKAIDKLKETLTNAMLLYEITEIKTATLKINFRKSESVEMSEGFDMNGDYVDIKTTISPNKARIKEALKSGIEIMGATLKQNFNLQIK